MDLGLLGSMIAVFSFVAILFLVIGTPMYFLTKAQCLESYSNYQPRYSFLTGCRIEWHGVLTPTEIITNINY